MISLDLTSALPEVFLACAAMALLMVGVFMRGSATRLVLALSVAILAVTFFLVVFTPGDRTLAFNGLFVTDPFTDYMKALVLLGAALTIAMSLGYIEREQMDRFELPILMLFATLGMLAMVSANDLISLYLGLELQSLSLYVIAAFRRDTVRSSEAGLKYFVLGALSSGMLLYGSSMVYGFAGSTNFEALSEVMAAGLASGQPPSVGLIVGLVFVLAGLAFKVSAVPFHMWTPDVYEGAPTPVTAFLASAPKVAAMALLVRVMVGPFFDLFPQWQQIVVPVALASMLLGAFAAIYQTNIKRLMAYSSIGHMGYVLVGLAAGTEAGVLGIVVYLAIYLLMNIGTFACILCMSRDGRMVEGIEDLKGLGKTNPLMAFALTILMFSMAGIPPLAGFFGKYFVFLAAIKAGLYTLAVIGVLSSVVGAFYYVRIVKLMYFDEPVEVLDRPLGPVLRLMIAGTSMAMIVFLLVAGPVVSGAGAAAAALFAV